MDKNTFAWVIAGLAVGGFLGWEFSAQLNAKVPMYNWIHNKIGSLASQTMMNQMTAGPNTSADAADPSSL